MSKGRACWSRPLKNQVGEARMRQGRNGSTTFLIVDAQSVKNTDILAVLLAPHRSISH